MLLRVEKLCGGGGRKGNGVGLRHQDDSIGLDQYAGESAEKTPCYLICGEVVLADASGLGIRESRPALQGRRQQQEQAASAQGTQGGAETVGIETALGIVDEDIQLGA